MLTTSELTRIARAVIAIRPDWQLNEVYTFLDQRMKDRGFHELATAAAWVAADPLTKKIIRLESSGPWWNLLAQGELTRGAPDVPDHLRCFTCKRTESECDGLKTQTHVFRSVTEVERDHALALADPVALERRRALIAQARLNARQAGKKRTFTETA